MSKSAVFLKSIFIILLGLALIFTLVPRVKVIADLNSRKEVLLQRKAELEEQHKKLNKDLNQAESLEIVEKIAREQLGMVKNGERLIVPVITRLDNSDKSWN
ncbi:MAG: FtsB family cell division protein [Syntrophomonadaceae bacterium]|jgi:cell division protein FtsB